MRTHVSGWPRIGSGRALKFATEAWLKGELGEKDLQEKAAELRLTAWRTMKEAGIACIPSEDFSFYDNMLDTAIRFSAIPERFRKPGASTLETAFAMARGTPELAPLPMKKWFITNYHYIVSELTADTKLRLAETPEEAFSLWLESRAAGIDTVPTLIGPWTFLALSRYGEGLSPADFADQAAAAWAELVSDAADLGIPEIRFEEPALTLDTSESDNRLFTRIWETILRTSDSTALTPTSGRARTSGRPRITVGFPFGDIRDSWDTVMNLPFDGVALDFIDGPRNLELIRERGFPGDRELIAGVVNGRNVRKNRQAESAALLNEITRYTKAPLAVGTSCSLLHVPLTLAEEKDLEDALRAGLAFAVEKLAELVALAKGHNEDAARATNEPRHGAASAADRATSSFNPVNPNDTPAFAGGAAFAANSAIPEAVPFRVPARASRQKIQAARFKLPLLPTTTIGSFPQSAEVRNLRARLRSGEIDRATYDEKIFALTRDCILYQEKLGLDVLVHGEFERNDMVEFFAEKLEGFAFTRHGWVQSYGTRCVKPPVIAGEVRRKKSLTVELAVRAQSLTEKPVKGMLTGPATILAWSFPREDISLAESAFQIARTLREEVLELEERGISIIQIDEAALREKMPSRKAERQKYLDWAIPAFRLCHAGVKPETQIHTHMCYSDFTEITQAIDGMDADVISFEAARSAEFLAGTLLREGFETAVGPGIWDIHSPRVPAVSELTERIMKMIRSAGTETGAANGAARDAASEWIAKLWINPDCGLKTRGWSETKASLENLVEAARIARSHLELKEDIS